MKQHWQAVLVLAALLGWLLDILFWRQALGANFPLYALLCLGGGLVAMRLECRRMAAGAMWLVPLIIAFAPQTILRAEPLTTLLGVLFTLVLLALLAATFVGGRWWEYSAIDDALVPVRLAWSMVARPLVFWRDVHNTLVERRGAAARRSLWPVFRGLLLTAPIMVVFGALLASADLVFGRELSSALESLRLERLPEYIFRLAYMTVAAYALIGVFIHAGTQSGDEKITGGRPSPIPRVLGMTEATIVQASVAVLFAFFVVVQFRYFFGGPVNISDAGYTYADYARRGFGELMAVACFSLVLVIALSLVTRRQSQIQRNIFSALDVVIAALVGVMLVSAYERLGLYEAAYGFSRLRTYVHVGLIWIGLLLGAVALLELLRKGRFFATAIVGVSLGFTASLAVLNVDAFIVRQNIGRSHETVPLDVPYLVSLSTDADPQLAAALLSPTLPLSRREAVGAVLACRLYLSSVHQPTDWRSWTVSRWQSARTLGSVHDALHDFHIANASDFPEAIAPSGAAFSCLDSRG